MNIPFLGVVSGQNWNTGVRVILYHRVKIPLKFYLFPGNTRNFPGPDIPAICHA